MSPKSSCLWRCLLLGIVVIPSLLSAAERKTIEMKAPLRFDPPRFEIEPGTKLTIRAVNRDSTDLPHNILFTTPGNLQTLVTEAMALGERGPELEYIPQSDDVLAASTLLKAGNREDLKFTVPDTPGIYPYVCTFPGHGMLMYGAMYVGVEMPPLEEDSNVPDSAKMDLDVLTERRPSMQRMFLPDIGPAAIAVALPGDQNYAWDAGVCSLRYIWQGAFIDARNHWAGNGNALAKVLGDIWWEAGDSTPLQIFETGSSTDERSVEFHGYRKQDEQPTFLYSVNGIAVEESIEATDSGLKRHFTLPNEGQVTLKPGDSAISIEGATSEGDLLQFTAPISFSIEIPAPSN